MEAFARTELLLGHEAMQALAAARVAVFGIGGVGGYVCEGLARCGVGGLDLFDHDKVSMTNLNRQIIALHDTLGMSKTEVMRQRIAQINPEARVTCHELFYLPENAEETDLSAFDYVVDCVDTVAAKLTLAERAQAAGVPVLSAMGAGNKLRPELLRVADIADTSVCPLARVMRRECRKRGIRHLKVVYSLEEAISAEAEDERPAGAPRRSTPGSAIFVPAAMGLMMAAEVVRDLTAGKAAVPREEGASL